MHMNFSLWLLVMVLLVTPVISACSSGGGGSSSNPVVSPAHAATTAPFLTGIALYRRTATSTNGVASVSCLAGESLTGGGAFCDGSSSSTPSLGMAGYLFASWPVGNTWYGGCYPMQAQNLTSISVYANCAQALTANAVTALKPELSAAAAPEVTVSDQEAKLLEMVNAHKARLQ